jgi:hypothetical protein
MIRWLIALIRQALAGLKFHRNSPLEILPLRHQLRDLRRSPVVGKNSIPSENAGLPSHFPESSAA